MVAVRELEVKPQHNGADGLITPVESKPQEIVLVDEEKLRDQQYNMKFIQLACQRGLALSDQEERKALEQEVVALLQAHNIGPTDPYQIARLGIFLHVVKTPRNRERRKMVYSYGALGEGINKEWFETTLQNEQRIISRAIGWEKRKAALARLLSTRDYRENLSKGQGGVRIRTEPFFRRGVHPLHIQKIVDLPLRSLQFQKEVFAHQGIGVKPDRSKSLIYANKILRKERKMAEEQKREQGYYIEFIKKLMDAGMITNDTATWDQLKSIYQQAGRPLIEDPFKRLALETFLKVQRGLLETDKEIRQENKKLLKKYIQLGYEVDRDWYENVAFINERYFISGAVALSYYER